MVDYRVLDNITDLEQVCDLEIAVWGVDPRDAVPAAAMHAMALNGGIVIGAYDAKRIVGIALAFPARRGKKWMLWSHMAGVHPDYRGQGIGFGLKQTQRTWALEHGYDRISWTFDPLQRGNANFNLHLLGATANCYHVDFYGEMTDAINVGLPSDRLEVVWNLRDSRVKALAKGSDLPPMRSSENPFLLMRDSHNRPSSTNVQLSGQPFLLVEIPPSLSSLKHADPGLALEWRLALRQVLQSVFVNGYALMDFVELDERSCYVLSAPRTWYLYVLRCSDDSLYTGVTPDLERRLSQHNAGRGAAYTSTRRPVAMLAAWRFSSRSDALKAEIKFKQLSRPSKLNHISQQKSYLGADFVQIHS
jgi:predicted GNAT superfamily acetyltransferase/predicted GIY-YIG superfamily endonuclease